jgi:hypothetical protein
MIVEPNHLTHAIPFDASPLNPSNDMAIDCFGCQDMLQLLAKSMGALPTT